MATLSVTWSLISQSDWSVNGGSVVILSVWSATDPLASQWVSGDSAQSVTGLADGDQRTVSHWSVSAVGWPQDLAG